MAFRFGYLLLTLTLTLALTAQVAEAQQKIAFGELNQDTTLPVQVTADQLAVTPPTGPPSSAATSW